MYFNIHTHHSAHDDATLSVQNLYDDFERASTGILCSLGLHPWHLENREQLLPVLTKLADLPNVLAIGECGLDKLCHTDCDLQVNVFKQQIGLANKLDKPLIVHCVRAFDELIKIIDGQPPSVPVVVHGFNKKGSIAEALIGRGIYLSFGAAILKNGSPAADALKQMPADRCFLETDNAEVPIYDIYRAAASIRQISEEAVILQVQQNFATVFKYSK